jgi:hypothetical protein
LEVEAICSVARRQFLSYDQGPGKDENVQKEKGKKKNIRKSQKITSPWSQATKTFEPHGLLGGGHGDRQAFFTGST